MVHFVSNFTPSEDIPFSVVKLTIADVLDWIGSGPEAVHCTLYVTSYFVVVKLNVDVASPTPWELLEDVYVGFTDTGVPLSVTVQRRLAGGRPPVLVQVKVTVVLRGTSDMLEVGGSNWT